MNFYEFPIPTQLDGEQFKAHLGADEVYIRDNVFVIGSDTLTLDQVTAGMASYVYVAPVEPTIAQKLESVGLNIADLKTALGL